MTTVAAAYSSCKPSIACQEFLDLASADYIQESSGLTPPVSTEDGLRLYRLLVSRRDVYVPQCALGAEDVVAAIDNQLSVARQYENRSATLYRLHTIFNSSEAKASRVIICKFPVKLPFPVHSVLQRASKSRHVHSNRVPGRLAGRHVIICACVNTYSLYTSYSVLGLRSVMTTALDSDERLHSEVGLKQERERTSHVRVRYARRHRLQRRTQRKP